MPQFLKYFPLTKVDEKTHTISGVATAEEPDKDGELCDYEGAKKAYAGWSKEASESTKSAGQEVSYGNIRVQHTLEIGGKVKAPVIFDDATKSVHLDTEPENDGIFTKAKKGFIRGFSHAGDYEWRRCNECKTELPRGNHCPKCKKTVIARYKPVLSEVSYVDNPCLKLATFALVKADGSTELKNFSEGSSAMEQTSGIADPAIDIPELIKQTVRKELGKATKYLVTDGDKQHLPYTDEDGKPNHRLMGAAWAALHGGYRGNKYEGPDKEEALSHLKELYSQEGIDTPSEQAAKVLGSVLNKSALPADLLNDLQTAAEVYLAMAEQTTELTALAGEKGKTTMSNDNPALLKARKSLVEHIQKAKGYIADHNSKMADCLDKMSKVVGENDGDADDAQKAASAPKSDDKPLEKKEPAASDKKDEPTDPVKEPSAAVQSTMQKMMGETFVEMFKATLVEMRQSPEVKKMIGDSIVSQMAETLGKQIQPDAVKVAGQTLVPRPGEPSLSKAASEDLNDTGL